MKPSARISVNDSSLPRGRMLIVRRLHFTLMELMVILFIMGMGAGLTGIKIKEVYAEQRYLSEIQQVASHLQMAQDLVLIMQKDVTFEILRDSAGIITYKLKVDTPLPVGWGKIVQKQYVLKSVGRIDFEGESTQNEAGIVLKFLSRGMAMSRGRLIFSKTGSQPSSTQKDGRHQITLLGCPQFIESGSGLPPHDDEKLCGEPPQQGVYPAKILEELYEKVK
jgi:type II secretory pathway pseudopilin PulG